VELVAWSCLALALLVVGYLVVDYRRAVAHRAGRILIALGVFFLPASAGMTGLAVGMERSKEKSFCLSCHEMERYGRSLEVDDDDYIPATHAQRGLIQGKDICFTCHTDYGWFGDVKAKLNGVRHVAVHYFGTVPEKITLYSPFANRNCLHCHEGTRAFLGAKQHAGAKATFAALRAGTVSCAQSGCHDVVHAVDTLGDATFWTPVDATVTPKEPAP